MVAKPKKASIEKSEKLVLWFSDLSIEDIPFVGGKNASLGEMYSKLVEKGINVPNGFAITSKSYRLFLQENGLDKEIKKALKNLDVSDVKNLARIGEKIRAMILAASLPLSLRKEITHAYAELCHKRKEAHCGVAVRSSATAEDLPEASFAGQQESFLNIRGLDAVLLAVKKCIASLFTDRAISYRETKGFDHINISLSVGVQEMVRSDLASSGVMFTMDTESGFDKVALINSSYGLGEYIVKGRVTPDQFYVYKPGITAGRKAVISRILGTKDVKLIYGKVGGTVQAPVSRSEKDKFSLTEEEAVQLTKWGMQIEAHYKKPQDIEWAKDGLTSKLYIVQARPETVNSRVNRSTIEQYKLKQKGKLLLKGISIGQKIGAGKVNIIESPKDMKGFKKGEVLVTRITDPDWEPIMRMASAIVTEEGGKTSHAAIVSREMGVPCVVGAIKARKIIKDGQNVTVSCAEGEEGNVYNGILPFEVKKTELKNIPNTKTKIMMNVGDPDNAFALSFLPNDGVGLAREEFIFTNFIRIHPLALINFDKLKDKKAKKQIEEITRGYKNKTQYCIDKLAEGIARIAAAFAPNDVIIRFSDFKTNEYATLVGGAEFEPKEENPMLGWRGASRYYSKGYREGFRLECEAIKKVRDEWGLTNVITMIPFCRTPEEGEKVIKTMEEYGLKRGKNGLQVYVMCEIPSNVILAEEFAKIFDGFSIGSNDLTQLTLGVDRDSTLVSHIYDERNAAVRTLIRQVIHAAHKHKKKIGICGQAPSDYPEFAEFLVREGIDSISLNPDTVVSTRQRIAYVEKTVGKTGKKTNKKFLSLVATLGLISASIIGIGAGCVDVTGYDKVLDKRLADESGTVLREKFLESMRQQKNKILTKASEDARNTTSTFTGNTFANFSLDYPSSWSVQQWTGGVTFKDNVSGEYVSIFKQIMGHPVADAAKQEITINGIKGFKFQDKTPKDGTPINIIELQLDKKTVLEIDGVTKDFDMIINSFVLITNSAMPDRALNHWDIQGKKLCVQMVAYAKEKESGVCKAFPTPCDVPAGWTVCGAGDAK